VTCERCQREIARGATYWAQISGWEQKRSQGGTNHVALRKSLQKFMCAPCMSLEKGNVNRGQQSF